jgi:integrase
MSLRRRGSTWFIDFVCPNGQRIRRSTETENKAQALELHDRLKSEAWTLQQLGERPKRLWEDAVVRWLNETKHKASHEGDKGKLRWLDTFLAGMELNLINRAVVDRITEAKRAEGVCPATVNRHLALVRAILRRAHREWEWIDRAPAVRLLKEPTRRIRFLTRDQVAALLKELPEHLRDMATFALATGLRAANVTGLTWEQVDLERKMAFVYPDQAKARKAIPVPFNDAAMDVVQRQKGKHFVKVFTFEGEPVKQVNTKAWKKALKRAGIQTGVRVSALWRAYWVTLRLLMAGPRRSTATGNPEGSRHDGLIFASRTGLILASASETEIPETIPDAFTPDFFPQ